LAKYLGEGTSRKEAEAKASAFLFSKVFLPSQYDNDTAMNGP